MCVRMSRPTPGIAIALNLSMLVVTVGYLVARAMGPARRLSVFEMGQTTVAVALGLGSALWLGAAAGLLAQPKWDTALLDDLSRAMADASICGLGQAAPNPIACVIKYFPEELK